MTRPQVDWRRAGGIVAGVLLVALAVVTVIVGVSWWQQDNPSAAPASTPTRPAATSSPAPTGTATPVPIRSKGNIRYPVVAYYDVPAPYPDMIVYCDLAGFRVYELVGRGGVTVVKDVDSCPPQR